MEHEYLTTAEVAEMLRVSPSTVSRWCLEGRYQKKYLRRTCGDSKGSKWLIHRDALKPKEPQYRQIRTSESVKQSVAKALELFSSTRKKRS